MQSALHCKMQLIKNGMALDIDKNFELRIPHTVDCVMLYKLLTSYLNHLNWHTIAIDRYDNKTRLRFRWTQNYCKIKCKEHRLREFSFVYGQLKCLRQWRVENTRKWVCHTLAFDYEIKWLQIFNNVWSIQLYYSTFASIALLRGWQASRERNTFLISTYFFLSHGNFHSLQTLNSQTNR